MKAELTLDVLCYIVERLWQAVAAVVAESQHMLQRLCAVWEIQTRI